MTQIVHSITSKIDIKNVCCAISLVCFTWVDLDLNIVIISLSRTTELISLDQMVMIYWPKNKEIWHISLQNESRAFMVSLVWGSWIPIKGLILQVSDQSFLSSVMSRSLPDTRIGKLRDIKDLSNIFPRETLISPRYFSLMISVFEA